LASEQDRSMKVTSVVFVRRLVILCFVLIVAILAHALATHLVKMTDQAMVEVQKAKGSKDPQALDKMATATRFLGEVGNVINKKMIHAVDWLTYSMLLVMALAVAGALMGGLIGSVLFRKLMVLVDLISELPAVDKAAVVGGVVLGLVMTALTSIFVWRIPRVGPVFTLLFGIAWIYLGMVIMMSLKGALKPYVGAAEEDEGAMPERPKILDTNVIIDGRIADICKTGFLDGTIYVPGFILDELQLIADSADPLKRMRGRRGLDILNQMQKNMSLLVRSFDAASSDDDETVDMKLVRLAKDIGGSIVTNDYNLNKVAQLQGVKVLNVNELANALKPVVLPGEQLQVQLVKEGKEPNQGIGYLDDGTMVVVESGKPHIGREVLSTVTSVLQTSAGKMIFTNFKNVLAGGDASARGGSNPGGR
jgi:uncharacterized protein YacL